MDRNLVIDPKSLTSEDLSLMELIRQFYSGKLITFSKFDCF